MGAFFFTGPETEHFHVAVSYQFHIQFHTPVSYPSFIPQFHTPVSNPVSRISFRPQFIYKTLKAREGGWHITRGARQVQRSVGRDSEESEVTATYDCVL